jgi:hypothetical protein
MNIISGANYYELFISEGKNVLNLSSREAPCRMASHASHSSFASQDTEYNIGISEQKFYEIMNKIDMKKNIKYFQREYKEYILKDLVCQRFINDEVKVIRKIPLNVSELNTNVNNFIQVSYNKTKLTLVNFDSIKNLHKVSYIKKLIFRISNRIYINFEISIDSKTKNKNYLVYINYNHDDNVDFNITNRCINDIIDMLQ